MKLQIEVPDGLSPLHAERLTALLEHHAADYLETSTAAPQLVTRAPLNEAEALATVESLDFFVTTAHELRADVSEQMLSIVRSAREKIRATL